MEEEDGVVGWGERFEGDRCGMEPGGAGTSGGVSPGGSLTGNTGRPLPIHSGARRLQSPSAEEGGVGWGGAATDGGGGPREGRVASAVVADWVGSGLVRTREQMGKKLGGGMVDGVSRGELREKGQGRGTLGFTPGLPAQSLRRRRTRCFSQKPFILLYMKVQGSFYGRVTSLLDPEQKIKIQLIRKVRWTEWVSYKEKTMTVEGTH